MPIRQLRYPLIDSLSEVTQSFITNALVKTGSNSVEQSGRWRVGAKARYSLHHMGLPRAPSSRPPCSRTSCSARNTTRDRVSLRHAERGLPNQSRSERAAYRRRSIGPMFTISPLSTQTEGWDDFVFDFAEFAASNAACHSSIKRATRRAELVTQRFGTGSRSSTRCAASSIRDDRMLNQYFGTYFPVPPETRRAERSRR